MSLNFTSDNSGIEECELEPGEYYVTDKHPDCLRMKLCDGKDVRIYADPASGKPVRGKVNASTDGQARRVEIVSINVRYVD